jgi:hypothetical protein
VRTQKESPVVRNLHLADSASTATINQRVRSWRMTRLLLRRPASSGYCILWISCFNWPLCTPLNLLSPGPHRTVKVPSLMVTT